MSPRRSQDQGKFDTYKEQVLQVPNDPLDELVANPEVRDTISLFARVVTTQLNRQKLVLENARVKEVQGERKRKVWGDNDPKYKRMLKVRNEKRKLYPLCAKCGKNHKGYCL